MSCCRGIIRVGQTAKVSYLPIAVIARRKITEFRDGP